MYANSYFATQENLSRGASFETEVLHGLESCGLTATLSDDSYSPFDLIVSDNLVVEAKWSREDFHVNPMGQLFPVGKIDGLRRLELLGPDATTVYILKSEDYVPIRGGLATVDRGVFYPHYKHPKWERTRGQFYYFREGNWTGPGGDTIPLQPKPFKLKQVSRIHCVNLGILPFDTFVVVEGPTGSGSHYLIPHVHFRRNLTWQQVTDLLNSRK